MRLYFCGFVVISELSMTKYVPYSLKADTGASAMNSNYNVCRITVCAFPLYNYNFYDCPRRS